MRFPGRTASEMSWFIAFMRALRIVDLRQSAAIRPNAAKMEIMKNSPSCENIDASKFSPRDIFWCQMENAASGERPNALTKALSKGVPVETSEMSFLTASSPFSFASHETKCALSA